MTMRILARMATSRMFSVDDAFGAPIAPCIDCLHAAFFQTKRPVFWL